MTRLPLFSSLALAGVLAAQGPPIVTAAIQPAGAPRPIDLAICLDISGSMDGLLNAARQNLWAVVNDLATLRPTPTLRVALLTYGCSAYDAETGWVRVDTGFTTDLDGVSQKLFALTTNGGEEYVARVVHAAVEQLAWSSEPNALKLLFVAGNEAATQDPALDSGEQSRAAIAKGIVVNSIFCGAAAHADAAGWRDVAKFADGQFAAIEQDNGVVVTTPFDKQLAELSAALNTTYVPYGQQAGVWVENQRVQDGNAASLNLAAAAQRCQTKAGAFYGNAQWDLVDACADPKFKLEDVKKEELAADLRAMSIEQLRNHVATQQKKRGELKVQVEALGKQRDAHVQKELQKLGEAGKQVFEQVIIESVRQQAEARGFHRQPASPPEAQPKGAAHDVESPFVPVIKAAVAGYQQFVRVTGTARTAPSDCRMPGPKVLLSTAEKEHGSKLYLLYARFADGLEYVQPGEPAKVGQTIVKEAWQRVDGDADGSTEASRRYLSQLVRKDGDAVYHAGDAAGLFVMHKLAAGTPDTDDGWVYATIDRQGFVTAAGRVASCMRCHQDATEDRRFGLR